MLNVHSLLRIYEYIYVRRHVQIYFVCFLINTSLITNRMCWNCMQTYRLDHLGSLHIVWGIRGYVIIANTLSLALTLSMYIYIYVYPGGLRPDLRGQHAASRYIYAIAYVCICHIILADQQKFIWADYIAHPGF